jgi:hypothetical protein
MLERTETRIVGFQSSEMDFQLMRSLGAGNYGGSAPGEVFHARGAILDDDPYAWPSAFAALAKRVGDAGAVALAHGHRVSAREQFLARLDVLPLGRVFLRPFYSRRTQLRSGVSRGLSAGYGTVVFMLCRC